MERPREWREAGSLDVNSEEKTEMEVGKTFESINLRIRNNFRSIFKSIFNF